MGKINVLDKHVAELIAAGEVVERPCSVIKELVENAIDAGACNVTVEIKHGGITYMRVTDDGSGILKEDIKKAFLKNATSKVFKADDLDTICTLGFRGEALASVCAVSKVELITKEISEDLGSHYEIEGGEETLFEDFGCPNGTTIIVKDLFFNVPARMKFLKKDVSEANAISKLLDRIALSCPDVKFKFIRDGKEVLNTPGDGKIDSAIYSVYGKEFSSSLIPVDYSLNNLKLKGFINKPDFSRPNRNMQHFFINGRYVRTKTAMAALEEAFKGSIVVKKFPACVLYINIPFNTVDVNVHPSKMEVRFVDERPIFQLVYHGVKSSLLENDRKNPIIKDKSYDLDFILDKNNVKINKTQNEIKNFNTNLNSNVKISKEEIFKSDFKNKNFEVEQKEQEEQKENKESFVVDDEPEIFIPKVKNYSYKLFDLKSNEKPIDNIITNEISNNVLSFNDFENENNLSKASKFYEEPLKDLEERSTKPEVVKTQPEVLQIKLHTNNEESFNEYEIIGEIFKTYIIIELKPNKLLFIDKHAAHERIIYEKLRKDSSTSYAQALLEPITVTLDKEEYDAILNNKDIFNEAGFELDDFGVGTVIVRCAPMTLDKVDIKDIVIEMAGYILENKSDINSSYVDWLYDNVACRSAIKAGTSCSKEEILSLVKKLEKEDVRYCPHGRPIFVEISKYDLEKKFFRK